MNDAELRLWDNEHVWHPFCPMDAYRAEAPPIITDADGFFLIDSQGNRYLDGVSSLWCNVHGHRVPAIDDAIRAQLDRVAHSTLLGLGNEPSIRLARALVERAPAGLTKVFFSDSGATAVEIALKLAFQYHRQRADARCERDTFVTLTGAYHGDTLGAVSVGGVPRFHAMFRPLLFPTLHAPAPVAYRVPPGFSAASYIEHCEEVMHWLIVRNAHRLAGVVLEPLVQAAAGMLVHPPGYLKKVREWTRAHDVLLIADEVAVGCGRLGTWTACEQEGVVPDLLCLAKGLSGGYLPIAATLATDAIFDAFRGPPEAGRTFFHGHTFTGNPLGCAAALASLRLIDDNHVLENARRSAAVLAERLRPLVDWPHVGDIRQRGLMVGIEMVADKLAKTLLPPTVGLGKRITLAARARGVIIRPLGDIAVLMPPPAMPTPLVHQLCDVLFAAIEEECRKLG